nr:hypothetical protein Hi04_10k_c5801_00033 [uncultured bacterium]
MSQPRNLLRAAVFAVLAAAVAACSGPAFKPGNVAKTDIDTVTDTHLRTLDADLRDLTTKLYKRNPRELKKAPKETIDSRLDELFGKPGPLRFPELNDVHSTDAMLLCFDNNYKGDRVFAVMAGLIDMLHKSYGYHTEFFVLDELNEQKLYDSARNIEILVWRLNHKHDPQGALYLLTNDTNDSDTNLSFERLFGKMIEVQDLMATIVSDRTQRSINHVVQSVATMVFLPI